MSDTTELERADTAPVAPLTTTVSIKPAASILLIAVVMLAVFMIINAVADQGVATSPTKVIVVGGLPVDTHSHLLSGCLEPGAPPSNISPAYIVPATTTAAGPINMLSAAPGAYDCERRLFAPYPQSKVLGFYLHQFDAQGWTVFSEGRAHDGGEQFLFHKAGNDTFYWIAGVTVNTSTPTSTSWTLRFYQDDSLDA